MKVIHILTQSLPLFQSNPWDGWHTRMAREILKQTDDHEIECWHVERSLSQIWSKSKDGIDFKIFPSFYFRRVGIEWSAILLRELKARLGEGQPVLVHIHGVFWPFSYAIARLCARVPLVATHHVNRFPLSGELSLRLKSRNLAGMVWISLHRPVEVLTQRLYIRNIDHLFVNNTKVKAYFAPILGADRVEVLPMGIDFGRFRPMDMMEARDKLGLDRDRKYIFYIGAMLPSKGLQYLLHAIPEVRRHYPESVLLLGGDGYCRQGLQALADKLDIRDHTHFLGYMDNKELPLWYNAADVCLLPSWNEALGVVAIEALACQRPYIGTNVGGIPDIIKNFNSGIVIRPRKSKALSGAIIEALAHPELFKVDRASGERHYSWSSIIKRTLAVYQTVSKRYYQARDKMNG